MHGEGDIRLGEGQWLFFTDGMEAGGVHGVLFLPVLSTGLLLLFSKSEGENYMFTPEVPSQQFFQS